MLISRKEPGDAPQVSPESILISKSTILFNESKEFKPGKKSGVFHISDIAHVSFYQFGASKEEPPEFCTWLILVSLGLLLFPGLIKLLGGLGFVYLFLILGDLETRNSKKIKYGLFLSLRGGTEIVSTFSNETCLRQTFAILYALKNSHPKLLDFLDQNAHVVVDVKSAKIVNPMNAEDVQLGQIVDIDRIKYSTIVA